MNIKTNKIIMIDGSIGTIKYNNKYKLFKSDDYNFFFNKKDGFFVRWGQRIGNEVVKDISGASLMVYKIWCEFFGRVNLKEFLFDLETDGNIYNFLPEIADIELSTSCHGVKGIGLCRFCYKSNRPQINGEGNMSLDTFKKIFKKLIFTVGQIAFGITDIDANPDMWKIFDYCRNNGVIPNVTINGDRMTPDLFDRLSSTMGAVATSYYDKNLTYNAIKELSDRGMKQSNIHYMLSSDTYDGAIQLMKDTKTDSRLKGLNALVFLSLKKKGRSIDNAYSRLSDEKFKNIVDYALDNNVPIGFDSCTQPKFIKAIQSRPNAKDIEKYTESCESTLNSLYINSLGLFFPCSFSENVKDAPGDWSEGINILEIDDFMKDVWAVEKTRKFANVTINNKTCGIACPMYQI